ncbi:TetR/AcrR family transcriptional regulator [Streptomyces sp. NPDC059786]|uniref:TetR/AcrR family transcriptional regulator n=1 Tax=Streptomyces sp. NPDC059786 TaxID=3346946 RepID=UPI00366450B3
MRAVDKSDLTGRARLRDAALELFAERGCETTSTRAVAAAAGLSPALVTRHFGSKEGLRAAVDEYVLGRIGAELEAVEAGAALMESLGKVSARLFGADPVPRGYLRHVLVEGSAASAELVGRLLNGARAELDRLSEEYGGRTPEGEWAASQVLCSGPRAAAPGAGDAAPSRRADVRPAGPGGAQRRQSAPAPVRVLRLAGGPKRGIAPVRDVRVLSKLNTRAHSLPERSPPPHPVRAVWTDSTSYRSR